MKIKSKYVFFIKYALRRFLLSSWLTAKSSSWPNPQNIFCVKCRQFSHINLQKDDDFFYKCCSSWSLFRCGFDKFVVLFYLSFCMLFYIKYTEGFFFPQKLAHLYTLLLIYIRFTFKVLPNYIGKSNKSNVMVFMFLCIQQ